MPGLRGSETMERLRERLQCEITEHNSLSQRLEEAHPELVEVKSFPYGPI